jgi:tetrahydromethanopterin S-methyltransferase subunit G
MSGQYKIGIFVGIVLGIVIYFVTIWLLPALGKLKWVFT